MPRGYYPRKPLVQRLTEKIRVREDGCWEWTGAINSGGYAHVRVDGRTRGAHTVVYELALGPVPQGLELDHGCRLKRCVNPAHLEPVPHRENVRRGRLAEATRERFQRRRAEPVPC